jgi:hypothetical protein
MLATLAFSSLTESAMMVEVDVDREKVLARGPRWVSLSSKGGLVSKPVPRLIEEGYLDRLGGISRLQKRINKA